MTKKTKETPPESGDLVDDLLENDLQNDPLREYLAGADTQNGKIKVYRRPEKGDARKLVWLFDTTPDELTHSELLERLRDDYGGGEFVARIYIDDGQTFLAAQRISVGAPIRREAPTISAPKSLFDDPVFVMMREQSVQQQNMLMGLMTALAGRPAPEPREGLGINDVLTIVERFSRNSDDKNVMDYVLQGIELGKQVAGNAPDNDEGGMLGALKALAPAIAAVASNRPESRPESAQRRPAPQQPRIAPESRQTAPESRQVASDVTAPHELPAIQGIHPQEMQVLYQDIWPYVRGSIIRDRDPATCVYFIIELLEEELGGERTEALATLAVTSPEEAVDQLCAAYNAPNYAPWLKRLRRELVGIYEESPETPEEHLDGITTDDTLTDTRTE